MNFYLENIEFLAKRFKFFRMGEWVDIVIDDQLPVRKRAAPSSYGFSRRFRNFRLNSKIFGLKPELQFRRMVGSSN